MLILFIFSFSLLLVDKWLPGAITALTFCNLKQITVKQSLGVGKNAASRGFLAISRLSCYSLCSVYPNCDIADVEARSRFVAKTIEASAATYVGVVAVVMTALPFCLLAVLDLITLVNPNTGTIRPQRHKRKVTHWHWASGLPSPDISDMLIHFICAEILNRMTLFRLLAVSSFAGS